jgi:hypothetical protein
MDRRAAKELMHIQAWLTLSRDLPAWRRSLQQLYEVAAKSIEAELE